MLTGPKAENNNLQSAGRLRGDERGFLMSQERECSYILKEMQETFGELLVNTNSRDKKIIITYLCTQAP